MRRATFIGRHEPELKGKTALVQLRETERPSEVVYAQFDEIGLEHRGCRLWLGWWPFKRKDFLLSKRKIER